MWDVVDARPFNRYENAEFNISTGETDYDVKAEQSLFATVERARYFELTTTQNITITFNDTGNDDITITSTEGSIIIMPFQEGLVVENVYITNASGSTAAITIFMTGPGPRE